MIKLFFIGCCLFLSLFVSAQPGKKQPDKPPTQKEMADMMKEMQKELDGMSPEEKKMMDSVGIKMPDVKSIQKNVSGLSDAQLKKAYEDESRIVPKRDATRIAAIPKAVTDSKMGAYIAAIQNKLTSTLKPEVISMGNKVYDYIKSNSKSIGQAGTMTMGLWVAGKTEMALYVLGKVCATDAGNTDNLSNYSAMLSMEGAQHLAIPILNNLNAKYPKNSTLLNNLGQAWFGLGEIGKADKYLDSAIAIYPMHSQANMTKAAIEESRGHTEKAKEHIKKSIQHAYTDAKENKLYKLGEKLTGKEFKFPQAKKPDPMNLGGFRSPDFPMSVGACEKLEKEWEDFKNQIDDKVVFLKQQLKEAEETAKQIGQQRQKQLFAVVKAAQENPGSQGHVDAVPFYLSRASKKYNAYMDLYSQKWNVYLKKCTDFIKDQWQPLKKNYEAEMEKLREEDEAQSGEGKPNEDFCPKYKSVSDKYLSTINPRFQSLYMEGLQLQKEYLNESAYWEMYIQWPEMFEVRKLNFQLAWLSALRNGASGLGNGFGLPFESITRYVCNETNDEDLGNNKLQNFDDVACQYKSKLNLGYMTIENNCSRMTSKLSLPFLEYTRKDNFERAEGDEYESSTIKISAEKGFDDLKFDKGPLKVEAKIGAGIELEMDRSGVKDVSLIAEAKIGAGTNVLDEGLEEHGNIAGKDMVDTTVEVGVEGRVSLISGHGQMGGSGKLEGIKIIEW
jgi:hypothetical protein